MKTIYVITHGDYSDYSIMGVFSTKEKAEEFVQDYNASPRLYNGEATIEEYYLDWVETQEPNFCILMDVNGKLYEEATSREGWFASGPNDECYGDTKCGPYKPDYWMFRMKAKSFEHAVKIANERRTQLIAMEKW